MQYYYSFYFVIKTKLLKAYGYGDDHKNTNHCFGRKYECNAMDGRIPGTSCTLPMTNKDI